MHFQSQSDLSNFFTRCPNSCTAKRSQETFFGPRTPDKEKNCAYRCYSSSVEFPKMQEGIPLRDIYSWSEEAINRQRPWVIDCVFKNDCDQVSPEEDLSDDTLDQNENMQTEIGLDTVLDQDEKYILNSPREISLNAELDHEEIDYFLKALEGVLVDLSERCRTLVNLLKKRDQALARRRLKSLKLEIKIAKGTGFFPIFDKYKIAVKLLKIKLADIKQEQVKPMIFGIEQALESIKNVIFVPQACQQVLYMEPYEEAYKKVIEEIITLLSARMHKLTKILGAQITSKGKIKRGKQRKHRVLSKQLNGISLLMKVVLEGVDFRRRRNEMGRV